MAGAAPTDTASPAGPRVLIVAEAAVAGLVAALVRDAGGVAIVATDAVQLAESFGDASVDRAIVGLSLGWAPAASLLGALRKRFPSTPLVGLGEPAAPGVLRLAVDHGVREVLPPDIGGLAALSLLLAEARGARMAPAAPVPEAKPASIHAPAVGPGPSAPGTPAAVRLAALEAELVALRGASGSSRFAAEVAHDLREPARASRLWLERLEARLAARDIGGAQAVAAKLYDAASRMEDLVDGALSDLAEESSQENPAQSHADRVLEEVLEQLEALLAETGGKVTHDALPEVGLHAHQLRQILQNLVANALRYAGKPPCVHVAAVAEADRWVLSVADNGRGIPVEQREAIFRPLTRLGGKDAPGGHGLGLAICKKVVERAGGRIWAEGGANGGSVFFVAIPTAPAHNEPVELAVLTTKRGES